MEMMEEEEEKEERKGGVSLTYTTFLFGHPAEGDSTILVHENRNNIAGKLTDEPFFSKYELFLRGKFVECVLPAHLLPPLPPPPPTIIPFLSSFPSSFS